jgi:hypothetical protein
LGTLSTTWGIACVFASVPKGSLLQSKTKGKILYFFYLYLEIRVKRKERNMAEMKGYEDGKHEDSRGVFWVKDQELHRLIGPAQIVSGGERGYTSKIWAYKGERHNLKGPAYIGSSWGDLYAIHGRHTESKEQFLDKSWRRKAFLQAITGELNL